MLNVIKKQKMLEAQIEGMDGAIFKTLKLFNNKKNLS
jgi:hypothetical protein